MNQHDQMREALEPIWYMHDNHCFTKLEGTVEQCLATLERLLNEGETYGMLCSKRKGFEFVHQKGTDDRVNFLSRCKVVLEQALAHVNETPKNEHDSDDVLNKSGNVDMTTEVLKKEFPLLDEIGLDQELHHCEWSIQQERKRLHQLLDELQAEQALAAEPAPLVRLTDDSLISIYLTCKAEWKATNKRERERIAVLFGHAIMDAMERVNGGQR